MTEVKNIPLHKKQKNFLKLLLDMDKIQVLKLSPDDKTIITAVISFDYYSSGLKENLERLRTRWSEARPNVDSNEYY